MAQERDSLRVMRLRRIPMLSSVDDERLLRLVHACEWHEVDSNNAIIVQDDPSDDVFFLCEGSACATVVTTDGREVSYERLDAPQLIGEIAAIDHGARTSFVVAGTACVVARLNGDAFRQLLAEDETVMQAVFVRMAGTIRYLMDRL